MGGEYVDKIRLICENHDSHSVRSGSELPSDGRGSGFGLRVLRPKKTGKNGKASSAVTCYKEAKL
jgi:hypothetical protein